MHVNLVHRRWRPVGRISYPHLVCLLLIIVAIFSEELDACDGKKGYGKKGFKGMKGMKGMKGKGFGKKVKSVGASRYDYYDEPMGVRSSRYSWGDYDDEPVVARRRQLPRQEVVVRHEYPRPSYHELGPARPYVEDRYPPMRYETNERPSMRREIGRAVTDALVRRLAVAM